MPLTTTATVELSDAARYMKQLCRHFGHKVDVTIEDDNASVEFPGADGRFTVTSPTTLHMSISTDDADKVEQFQGVVDRHLEKFAFRELPLDITWSEAAAAAAT